MKKLISLLLVGMLVLGLAACQTGGTGSTGATTPGNIDITVDTTPQDSGNYGGVLDVCWVGTAPSSYSPTVSGNSNYVWTTAVFEGILSRDASGQLQPGVCDFTLSDDQLTLTLTPREGVTFHNGKAVTIDDIWASIWGNKDPKMEDIRALIEGGEPTMDYATNTMTIKFTEYNSSTLYYLSQNATYLPVLPKECWEKHSTYKTGQEMEDLTTDTYDPWEEIDEWELESMIGTGPYKIDTTRWEDGYRVCLVKYDNYAQKANDTTLTGMAGGRYGYMDEINIWYNSEAQAVVLGLRDGTYDIATVPADNHSTLTGAGLNSYTDPSKKIVYMAFNTNESFTMQDANLRKAIAAAVDYEMIMQIQYGVGSYDLDTSPMANGTAYYTDRFTTADYAGTANLTLAKEYLSKSSYAGEKVVFLYDNNQADLAAYIAEVMKQLGVTYEGQGYDNATWKSMYADTTTYDFDFIIAASVQAEPMPNNMVTNLRVRFWACNETAKEDFNGVAASISGSTESIALWDAMLDKWVDDAHIVPLGCQVSTWYAAADLTVQFPGAFVAFYNCYWNDPSAHKA